MCSVKNQLALLIALAICHGTVNADDVRPGVKGTRYVVYNGTAQEFEFSASADDESSDDDEQKDVAQKETEHEHHIEVHGDVHSSGVDHVIVLDKNGKEVERMQLHVSGLNVPTTFELKNLPGSPHNVFMAVNATALSKYMIGVNIEPASELLISHLGLEKGTGLVIQRVYKDSAADKAGLKKYDILTDVGDAKIGSVEQLGKALDTAAGKEVEVRFIRAGKPDSVMLTASERPSTEQATFRLDEDVEFDIEAITKGFMSSAPGLRINRNSEMQKLVKQAMKQAMDQQGDAMKLADQARAQAAEIRDQALHRVRVLTKEKLQAEGDVRSQLDQLRKEMAELRSLIKQSINSKEDSEK